MTKWFVKPVRVGRADSGCQVRFTRQRLMEY